ncbi:MAG: T9SS type A sorting domain-containing protein, partial [Ignavibacteriaceae bacterium]|nr:T9SS type A sorting domain-containing protein [Ignavibacteriaceae bacterium]
DFPVSNYNVSLNQSNLDMGNFYVYDAETGEALGQVPVNYQGGFSNFVVPGELAGKESRILKLLPNPTGIQEESDIPGTFTLYQNYPNPFSDGTLTGNSSTEITWSLGNRSAVDITVYDITGVTAINLLSETKEPGLHSIKFEPKDLPAGVYLIKVTAGSQSKVIKAVYLK